jgi:myo-inositol-1(or 4)-monophosphatase
MLLPELEKLQTLVRTAAREELLGSFGHSVYEYKDDGSVITPADIDMQNRLQVELKHHWPVYDILGEEMSDTQQQAVIKMAQENQGFGYWCIDPLDGTNNYVSGVPFFSVSVALIIDNQQQIGLVYDPLRDEMFTAVRGQGACLNDQQLGISGASSCNRPAENKPVVAEIDIKRLPESLAVKLVTENISASQRNMGSAALDWCWLAARRFDVFLNGGHKLWDYAAGSLIFSEAGGQSISLDSAPVFRGRLECRSVLACNDPELFNYWARWAGIGDRLTD